ncbi:Threonine synthase [Neomoorella glycerini]|uniref:Threonine synthase n=1 Tax=Neomoorella glycerini TaxID=55779 RepID=A0A6I5ZWN2_9FIRM|nr:threonine synthase [Moorella glycerini]QGP94045.1 Threonine synthase [Moorella glycerini]
MGFVRCLECPKCHSTYSATEIHNLCQCGSPLLVRYEMERLGKEVKKEDLKGRRADLWRYWEFLPLEREENIISLGEGFTPIFAANNLGRELGFKQLYIKDEGLNPTGTFKARGAAVGVSRAKELGIKTIAMPTAGNAGGAWSSYGAKAGMEMIIVMPVDAPDLAKKECVVSGARTYLVKGLISDAGKIIAQGVKKYDWFDASTLKEPYRIEGKKTMGLEIAEQFNWELPDAVLYPTGGGVGIIGIWKALQELQAIGWIKGPLPKMISVQAEGCSPIVKAFQEGKKESEFFHGAQTIAGGIRVPKALGDFLVLEAVYESGGTAVSVSDDEILAAVKLVARTEGMFICPEGAAAVAGAQQLLASGFLKPDEKVVVLNTGSGLKYPEMVELDLPVLEKEAEI